MVNLLAELGPLTVVLRKIRRIVTRKVWGLVKIAKARILNTKKQRSYSVQRLPKVFGVGRRRGVGWGRGVGVGVAVAVAVGLGLGVTLGVAVGVGVAVG